MSTSLEFCPKHRRSSRVFVHTVLLLAICLIPSLTRAFEIGSSANPTSIQGYVSGKYVYRTTTLNGEKFSDQDLFTDLRIDISKPRTNSYEFHFFGTARSDFSNKRDATGYSPFESIGDSYKTGYHAYLYEAHLDANNPVAHVTQVRLGRQDGTRDEPIFFDGIAADINLIRQVGITAYGGNAVHFYPFTTQMGSDTLQGIGLDVLATATTLVSLDYLHVTDKKDITDTADHNDEQISLRINHRFSPNVRTAAKVRYLNGEARDMNIRVVGTTIDYGMELNVAYNRQFNPINDVSTDLSPFNLVLGSAVPYESYDVRVRKLFGSRVAIDLGYFQRSLVHPEDEGTFNHKFNRTYAVLDINGFIVKELSVAVTGEQWKSGDRSLNSGGLDLGYTVKPKKGRGASFNLGTYYSLYKYDDYFTTINAVPLQYQSERQNVQTYYAKCEFPFAQRYSFKAAYEFEKGLENYQTAKIGLRYDF